MNSNNPLIPEYHDIDTLIAAFNLVLNHLEEDYYLNLDKGITRYSTEEMNVLVSFFNSIIEHDEFIKIIADSVQKSVDSIERYNIDSYPLYDLYSKLSKFLADYEGFFNHLNEYEQNGLPTDFDVLIKLAKKYNCEIPKTVNGELVFKTI